MRYILDKRWRLRGWVGDPCGVYDTEDHSAHFLPPELFRLVARCDAVQELNPETLAPRERESLRRLEDEKVIRPASRWDFLLPEQKYHAYPARYRNNVHWSVTGACNLRCRHCFMSAPHAKHGAPGHEEIMRVADQLAECGIFNVGITGGEPLVREDFAEIIRAMTDREIRITTIFTNGWLVDEKLLDTLEKCGQQPEFQLSYDGVGRHDFLRGVPGAEKKVLAALKLLRERGYATSASMCLHRKNADTLRESVRLLASLGVSSLKCSAAMELGEWTDPKVKDLRMTREEEMELFESYIPQYFEDDAPLSISLSGAFGYRRGSGKWGIFYRRECPPEQENEMPACPVLRTSFYIGADGIVAPCQGMCDSGFADKLPGLRNQPLKEILTDSAHVSLSCASVGDVRRGNKECENCEYKDRCAGGCRNMALTKDGNYYGADPEACWFFRNGGEERIRAAAQPAFEEYLKRCPPAEGTEEQAIPAETGGMAC